MGDDKTPERGSFAQQLVDCAETLGQLVEYRNSLVVRRRRQGASLRQIASEAGLSHTAVAKIVAKA